MDQLPDVDLVVLSHHHGDHFDEVAADRLDKDLPIVTEPHSARKLVEQGFRRAIPIETWHSQSFRRGPATLRVTATPGKHARPNRCSGCCPGSWARCSSTPMDAEQGVKALRIIRPRTAVPIHDDGYTVFTSGLDDFRRAVDRSRLATEIHEVGRGETWTFDAPRGGAATS